MVTNLRDAINESKKIYFREYREKNRDKVRHWQRRSDLRKALQRIESGEIKATPELKDRIIEELGESQN